VIRKKIIRNVGSEGPPPEDVLRGMILTQYSRDIPGGAQKNYFKFFFKWTAERFALNISI
jgi:hypothetical protein